MPLEDYGVCRIDDLKNKRIQIKKLIRWKVPANSRKSIIKELVRLGIHNQVLYPDLDGLAKGLWQIEVVRGPIRKSANLPSLLNTKSKS